MSEARTAQCGENMIDEDLQSVLGSRYQGEAKPHPVKQESAPVSLWHGFKWPAFFVALGMFIGWAAHMGLMDQLIAIPGMCVCAACFGWHLHK